MNEYSFEVGVRAVVRVQASNPDMARKVVDSVLGSPGSQEIELANQNNLAIGRNATVTAVDFVQKTRAKLLGDAAGRSAFVKDPLLPAESGWERGWTPRCDPC